MKYILRKFAGSEDHAGVVKGLRLPVAVLVGIFLLLVPKLYVSAARRKKNRLAPMAGISQATTSQGQKGCGIHVWTAKLTSELFAGEVQRAAKLGEPCLISETRRCRRRHRLVQAFNH